MSRQHGEARPLSRHAQQLVAAAREGGGPPPGAKARVRGAIAVALAGGAGAGIGAGSVGAAKLASGSAASVGASGASAAGAVASTVAMAGGIGLGAKVAIAVLALSAVGGAWMQLGPRREEANPESPASIDEASARPRSAAPTEAAPSARDPLPDPTDPVLPDPAPGAPAIEDAVAEPARGGASAPVHRAARPVAAEVERAAPIEAPVASTLMEEMALLSPARAALARRDSAAARTLVDRYRSSYPSGAFTEEFAAIEVEALCLEGHPSAAASRARFERAHPGSTYAARLARACD